MENIFMYKSVHYGMYVCLSICHRCQNVNSVFLIHHLFGCIWFLFSVLYAEKQAGHTLVSVAEKLCILQPPIQWIFYILEIKGWGMKIKLFVCLESQQQQKDLTFPLTIVKSTVNVVLSEDVCCRMKKKKNRKEEKGNAYLIVICDKI